MKKIFLIVLLALNLCIFNAYAWDDIESGETQTQTSATVTSTASEILAENASGRDIFIQNNDDTGIVYLNLSGTATASGSMITLNPGDSITISNSTNAVSAIGSIASNANVAVSEGN